jgi:hypothetical protein
MAANAADLCLLADLKAWLNIPVGNTTDDVLLQSLLTRVSITMQNWMNRNIPSATYTETRDGNGSDALVMPNKPITDVTSVIIGGKVIPESSDGIQNGYVFGEWGIYLLGYSFTQGRRNVKVTYVAGYNPLPFDLAQACIEQAAYQYRAKSHIGQTGTGMGPEHISFSEHDFTPGTRTLMQQYKSVSPV